MSPQRSIEVSYEDLQSEFFRNRERNIANINKELTSLTSFISDIIDILQELRFSNASVSTEIQVTFGSQFLTIY